MESNFSKFIHCNQFQFCMEGNDAHTRKFKKLKSGFDTFHHINSFFPHLQVHYFPLDNFFLVNFMNKNR